MTLQTTSNYTFNQLINSNYKGKDVSLNFQCKDKCKIAALIIGGVVFLPLLGVGALLLRSAYITLRDRKVELLNEAEALIQTEASKQASKVLKIKNEARQDISEMEKEAAESIDKFNQLKADQALRNRGLTDDVYDKEFDLIIAKSAKSLRDRPQT